MIHASAPGPCWQTAIAISNNDVCTPFSSLPFSPVVAQKHNRCYTEAERLSKSGVVHGNVIVRNVPCYVTLEPAIVYRMSTIAPVRRYVRPVRSSVRRRYLRELRCANAAIEHSRTDASMWQLDFIQTASLPRLAWCVVIGDSGKILVHHGPWIEVSERSFVEGSWSGSYCEMDFPHATTFTGSGAVLTSDGVLFATPTNSVEPLYTLRDTNRIYCSNSLRLLLSSSADDIDYRYFYYDLDITSLALEKGRRVSRIPTCGGKRVTIHRYCNVLIGRDLSLNEQTKKRPKPFVCYTNYRTFLDEQVYLTIQNSADARRLVRYTPICTISSGYDSVATSVIAKSAGCKEFFTFATSGNRTSDSGKVIGNLLGIEVTEHDPTAYFSRNDLPEAEFVATGGGGGSVIFTALEQRLAGKILLTGNYGGEAWERANNRGGTNMTSIDSAGADMLYFRARVGFLHLAVPSIGYSEYSSLQRIANSEEMRPYCLRREEYDRPIPRRIAEEAGVPRVLFGQCKKFAARSMKYCNPFNVIEPELQYVMGATSYLNFCKWAEPIKLYSNRLDRTVFTLMHKLYCFNIRIIRSKKVRTLAGHLGLPVPAVPWLSLRFSKGRTRHRLLFHWGMEHLKPRDLV
jgi:hypothetical protein